MTGCAAAPHLSPLFPRVYDEFKISAFVLQSKTKVARIPHMKTKHHNYSDDKCFCAAVVGQTLTTYHYFDTLQEAQFHATSSKELLGMIGIEVEVAVFERREEPRIDGFKQHELN